MVCGVKVDDNFINLLKPNIKKSPFKNLSKACMFWGERGLKRGIAVIGKTVTWKIEEPTNGRYVV